MCANRACADAGMCAGACINRGSIQGAHVGCRVESDVGARMCGVVQREVGRKLYARLPELSQLLDVTLARAPKEQFGAPSPAIWQRMVVRGPRPPPNDVVRCICACMHWSQTPLASNTPGSACYPFEDNAQSLVLHAACSAAGDGTPCSGRVICKW